MSPASSPAVSDETQRGTLHVFVAFDWGEEINLDRSRQLVPGEVHDLPRRRRTPTSFAYRPAPLEIGLGNVNLELPELGRVVASARMKAFEFAAVTVAFRLPFELAPERLTRLAGALADSTPLVQAARTALGPLHQQLRPAIVNPHWHDDLSEDFLVFQLSSCDLAGAAGPDWLEGPFAAWLASLVHLEGQPLSRDEIAEALRLRLRYGLDDLFISDWAAAVLIDRDCDETLEAVEFANLQLLEFRNIDDRLDQSLSAAYKLIHPLTQTWLPFWRLHARPLRVLGELKVEANELFERTENVLKLVGDPYLARVYRLAANRFHLQAWEQSIQRKLEVAEGVHQVLSDQATTFRTEFLEALIVLLIILEIALALGRNH